MKNIFSILTIALFAITITSCQKVRKVDKGSEGKVINETYQAQITSNESYTFHLPNNQFVINKDALNASISLIDKENNTYNYTPKDGFVGTEKISLSSQQIDGFCGTTDDKKSRCRNKNSKQKKQYNYLINLTVEGQTK